MTLEAFPGVLLSIRCFGRGEFEGISGISTSRKKRSIRLIEGVKAKANNQAQQRLFDRSNLRDRIAKGIFKVH